MGKKNKALKEFNRKMDEKFNNLLGKDIPKKKVKIEKPRNNKFNILEDTLKVLKEMGKTVDDVKWVGGKDFRISWDNFETIANIEIFHTEARDIAADLVIVGDDWWLERDFWGLDGYYSGWAFETKPNKPDDKKFISNLLIEDHDYSLRKANEEEK
jgi:hypothetical protein